MKPVITSSRIVNLRHVRGRDGKPCKLLEVSIRLPSAMPVRDEPSHTWLVIMLFVVIVTACGLRACNEANETKAAPVAAEMEAGR